MGDRGAVTFDDLRPELLANPATFAQPLLVQAIYRQLRRTAPLAHVEPKGYRPFWLLTRHADIMNVERQPEVYAASPRTVLLPDKVEAIYEKKYGDRNGVKPLTHMDGEYHRDHRAVTRDWFGLKNLKHHERQIAAIAKEFVDRMQDFGGKCDFTADIAYWFPLRVVMTLMGVPRGDEAEVLRMTQRLFSPADRDLKPPRPIQAPPTQVSPSQPPPSSPGARDVIAEFASYYHGLGDERRKTPRNDIISTIANGQVNGCPMAYHEMTSYYIIVSTAGHDTTAASIGGGLDALLDFPDQLSTLQGDLDLLSRAAEEFVRWVAPVKHFMRTPNQDVMLHDTVVPAGEAIMLSYPSACRDELVYEDPDRLRIDRPPTPYHLAFGYGPHFCLGRYLATMEIRALFRELLPRIKWIERAGTATHIESVFVSGLKSLPVSYQFK